jgi:phage N-6-adenine-methyltransferase
MNQVVPISSLADLPSMIDRAALALSSARTAAEILEVKEAAGAIYDAAKRSARFAKAKGAHDELISASHRAQADALDIEARAKRRLADEYDAAQERGEVAKGRPKSIPDENTSTPTTADIGISSKEIFEAREIRDAEVENPGIVRQTLDDLLDRGEEPTRAAVNREVVNRTSFTGNNEWFTPIEHIAMARDVLGSISLDPASNGMAQTVVQADKFFTESDDGLKHEWHGTVWLNPPYTQPDISHFIDKIVEERISGRMTAGIMLTHNYTDTAWFQKAARNAEAMCFTRGRIRFISPEGKRAAPTQGQTFFYFGDDVAAFEKAFSEIGFVVEVMG